MGKIKKIIKNRMTAEVFISLVTLSIPTILEEMLATLLQYVDTAMVGRLGEEATAAMKTASGGFPAKC
jgi:Na+-driven multidrug efflux pump